MSQLNTDSRFFRETQTGALQALKPAPAVEVMLWHCVPKIKLDIDAKVTDVTTMTTEDLRAEIAELLARL